MRIVVITGRAAADHVRRLVEGIPDVRVVEMPIAVMGLATVEALARILRERRDLAEAARWGDVAVIPGMVRGDARVLSEILGIPVYKGTRLSGGIPFIIDYLRRGGRLDPVRPADEVVGSEPRLESAREAFRVAGVPVPERGPPVVLASEVPPETPRSLVAEEARRLARQGAQVVVVGALPSWDPGELAARVSEAARALEGLRVAVAAEAPTPRHAREAVQAGAAAVFSTPSVAVEAASGGAGDAAFVVGDRSVEALRRAVESLREVGVERVIVDPVVDLPPLGLARSISRYVDASRLGVPMLFSAANAANEVEADTHGVHALLALLAVEVGASVYLAVEDSWKNRWSTSEAREALRLAWEAWRRGSSERGLFSRLLVVKEASKPPSSPSRGAREVGFIPPRLDPRGYVLVKVDYDEGYLLVEWRPLKGGEPLRLRGRHALSLARALVREVGMDAEHAAYLGYELAKAEIALRTGKGYTQDEPVILPVWER